MNVKELKESIKDVPDDYRVMLKIPNTDTIITVQNAEQLNAGHGGLLVIKSYRGPRELVLDPETA